MTDNVAVPSSGEYNGLSLAQLVGMTLGGRDFSSEKITKPTNRS